MANDIGVGRFIRAAKRSYSDKEFSEFQDANGFSVVGVYDGMYRKQMGVSRAVDVVPFFKFYFDDEDIEGNDLHIPLKIQASMTSRVTQDGEVRYMLNDSRIKRLNPIDLIVSDDFSIGRVDGLVYEMKKGEYQQVDLNKVYGRIYKAHTSSITTLRGLYYRFKLLALRKAPTTALALIAWCLGWTYWWLKGKRFTYNYISESVRDRMGASTSVAESEAPETTIDFFGYKVGVWTLTTYSVVMVILFLLTQNTTFVKLPENNALTGVYTLALAIFSIVLYDKILPTLNKATAKWSSRMSFKCSIRGVKIKV